MDGENIDKAGLKARRRKEFAMTGRRAVPAITSFLLTAFVRRENSLFNA